ncbi:hypothetical protein VPH35_112346 [Triticum aestivum]
MRSTASRGPYPSQLTRKPWEEELNRAFTGRRSRSRERRRSLCIHLAPHSSMCAEARTDGCGLPAGISRWCARRLGTRAPVAKEVCLGARRRQCAPRGPRAAYFLVHISLLELVFTSGHIYTSPPTATYHGGGRWLCQAVNTNRQLSAGTMNQQVSSERLKFLAIICSRPILTIGFLVFSLVVLYIVSRRIGLLYQLKTSWRKCRIDLLKQMLLPSMMNCDYFHAFFIHELTSRSKLTS